MIGNKEIQCHWFEEVSFKNLWWKLVTCFPWKNSTVVIQEIAEKILTQGIAVNNVSFCIENINIAVITDIVSKLIIDQALGNFCKICLKFYQYLHRNNHRVHFGFLLETLLFLFLNWSPHWFLCDVFIIHYPNIEMGLFLF